MFLVAPHNNGKFLQFTQFVLVPGVGWWPIFFFLNRYSSLILVPIIKISKCFLQHIASNSTFTAHRGGLQNDFQNYFSIDSILQTVWFKMELNSHTNLELDCKQHEIQHSIFSRDVEEKHQAFWFGQQLNHWLPPVNVEITCVPRREIYLQSE